MRGGGREEDELRQIEFGRQMGWPSNVSSIFLEDEDENGWSD